MNRHTNRIYIKNLSDMEGSKYLCKLNNDILKNYKYVTKLRANYNQKITNMNRMTKLIDLFAIGSCGTNDGGIINLDNLAIQNVDQNSKITNINRTMKLKELHACESCRINDGGIINLNDLVILYASDNSKIININHMTKIKQKYMQNLWQSTMEE